MIWLLVALLILASSLVSAAETALFALPRRALLEFEGSRHHLQRAVAGLMRQPRSALMTVIITNTLINVTIFAISYVALEQLRHRSRLLAGAVSIGILFALIVFGEVVPKAFALANPKLIASIAGGLISILHTVFAPLRWLLSILIVNPITRLLAPARRSSESVSTDELQLLVEHSAREGFLSSTENEMLQSVVGLADVRVREVMTPRVDIEFLRLDEHPRTTMNKLKESRRRILPVCGRDLDDIRGAVYARDPFLMPHAPLRSLLRTVAYVPEQVRLTQLMRSFHQNRSYFAVVVDEFGGTAGLVTIEDVVESIVGDIPQFGSPRDEADTERLDENTYRVSGNLSVRDWAETFAVQEIDCNVDTVGGLVLSRLGRLPRPGDSVHIRNLTLTVEAVRRRRIERVILHRDTETAVRPVHGRKKEPA